MPGIITVYPYGRKRMKIKYKENSLFKHPETPEEAKKLMEQMTHFNEIKDCDGVFF